MLNLIKPLLKRFDIDWNNISIFAKVRLIWFGPPTLICWMSAPVFFVIALITWSGKYAEDGGMAVLLGYIGLFLSGIKTIKETGKFFVSENLHGSKLGAIGGGLGSMLLEIVGHFVMFFWTRQTDKDKRDKRKAIQFQKEWKENMKNQQELNRERDD